MLKVFIDLCLYYTTVYISEAQAFVGIITEERVVRMGCLPWSTLTISIHG